jgi:hypothetical protein
LPRPEDARSAISGDYHSRVHPLADLPRLWPTIGLPGIVEGLGTYFTVDLDAMPPVSQPLDGSFAWLTAGQAFDQWSLQRGRDDPVEREADAGGLAVIADGLPLPRAFERFITDPEPRRHVRSATACYLDLGQHAVDFEGGRLVHFLSDQQWVLHWLLWVGVDGHQAVVVTPRPLGFDLDERSLWRSESEDEPATYLAVCSDSFEEFLWRYWAMNELFFRLVSEQQPLADLPAGLRDFAAAYPRTPSPTAR